MRTWQAFKVSHRLLWTDAASWIWTIATCGAVAAVPWLAQNVSPFSAFLAAAGAALCARLEAIHDFKSGALSFDGEKE